MFKVDGIGGAIAGIFLLILVYLVLTNYQGTIELIGKIGGVSNDTIKTLQARS